MITDLDLSSMIDARLVPDEHEASTPGEAVAGMILHGVGLAHRPLSLTPQFFAHTPRARLCRPGVRAALGKRFQLGRTLEEVQASGCALLWSAWALARWTQERMAPRCQHLDPTRCARSGPSVPESDQPAMRSTPGDAKEHRPDLKQVV